MFKQLLLIWIFTLLAECVIHAQMPAGPGGPGLLYEPAVSDSLSDDIADGLTIRKITVEGNKITKPGIVFREVTLRSGTRYSPFQLDRNIRQTREQLMNTLLFVSVSVNKVAVAPDSVDIEIQLTERWYFFPIPYFNVADRNWNVWLGDHLGSLKRTQYGLKLEHNNISGRNDRMNFWVVAGYTQQVEFKYQLPFVDRKMEKGWIASLSYGRNRELNYGTSGNKQLFHALPGFGRDYFKGELAFSYRKGSQMRFYLRSMWGFERIDSAFFKLNPNYLNGKTSASYLDLTANYKYLNVDYIPFPLRGWLVDVYAIKRFSGPLGMVQVGGKALATWPFLFNTYVNFQTAFAYTLSSRHQPFFNTRMMGYGSLYMQGLEYYVMDGTFAVMGRTTLRRQVAAFSVKGPASSKSYSTIPFRLFLKTYGNIGYAYSASKGNNLMNNRLLSTSGAGLEIATIYDLVLKLEYSLNQFGEKGFFIHTATDF